MSLISAFVAVLASCAGLQSSPHTDESIAEKSRIDISYILGHNLYRFHAESLSNNVRGQSFLDKQLLKTASLDRSRYTIWAQKVIDFVSNAKQQKSAEELVAECRTPYSVTLEIGQHKHIAKGCRSDQDGVKLALLAKEAEFLLYSKN
jgi:hypothetical protein